MTKLPHTFCDRELLELALTHSSVGAELDNERLEFLGDAVLDLIVAEELYRQHPDLAEGELTERKAWVVSRRVLAEGAQRLGLEGLARYGGGLGERGLPRSVLANLYEAVLGAVFLDAGLEPARHFVRRTLRGPLGRVQREEEIPNPKQFLQHLAQARTGDPPRYALLDQRGQSHSRAFLIAAEIGERRFPSAWGRTRKEAERWAAHEALLAMQEEDEAE